MPNLFRISYAKPKCYVDLIVGCRNKFGMTFRFSSYPFLHSPTIHRRLPNSIVQKMVFDATLNQQTRKIIS